MAHDTSSAVLAIKADADITINGEDAFENITWNDGNPTNITAQQIIDKQAELAQAETDAEAQKATDKANAKAKLIAGEALTEAEADTIVI